MQMELTSSAAGSRDRASLGPVPGSAEAQKMTVTSGRKCYELLKLSGQGGSLARMSEILFQWKWASSVAFLTWKMQVMPSKHLLSVLSVSMPRTNVIGAGLWRTPDTGEGGTSGLLKEGKDARENGQPIQVRLVDQVNNERLWPTPDATPRGPAKQWTGTRPSGAKETLTLQSAAKMWPTPHANASTGPGRQGREGGDNIQTAIGGSLNPNFVEYLMGFPKSWTEAD